MTGRLDQLPLSTVRVADFTWAAAGPFATLLLTSMGAQVIKVSSARAQGGFPQQRTADVGRYLNYSKLSVSLDLTTPEGASIAKELISVCDLVVENYRPGTMKRFGLDYEQLAKVKPDIVMVSCSSLGSEGPQSCYTGFAPIFAAMGGLSHITGYPDGVPTEFRITIDYTVGHCAAYAALVGIYRQRSTGEGQYIDLASRDIVTCLLGERILDAGLNGPDSSPRVGNRDEAMAPHGVYRCTGEAYISIAVSTQDEWRGLCGAMGRQEWLSDERFADGAGRLLHREELDAGINDWTATRSSFDLMEMLQGKGVAAVPSYSARDVFDDPHLKEREFFQEVTEPSGEVHTVFAAPWLVDGRRPGPTRPAPSLGQDNLAVFGDLLGVSASEIERLTEGGVLR